MLNRIIAMGRITKEIELRRTDSGKPVVSFSIACERDFKDDSGQRATDFLDVVAWNKTAEFVNQYFSKGRMAVVSGRLQIRTWTDKEGNNRRSAEIVADSIYFGDSKPDGAPVAAAPVAAAPVAAPVSGGVPVAPPMFQELDDDDETLPF